MARRSIWQKPAIRLDEESEQHRKVTWLELFFDLFFVVAVAQLGHMLAHNPTADGLVRFVLLFMPVFWVWIGMTYYNERFETEGLENRLAALLLMLPVIGMSITAHHALDAGHSSFTGFA
ncbi:MAG: low temperature requirement protein A, partial [Planctomycetota bacterium]